MRHVVFPGQPRKFLINVTQLKIQTREVERNWNALMPQIRLLAILFANLLEHEQVEFLDQVRILKDADKFYRRQKAMFRIIPTGKRLKATKLIRIDIHNRLVIHLDVFIFHSLVNVRNQVHFQALASAHLVGIKSNIFIIDALGRRLCKARTHKATLNIFVFYALHIHARLDFKYALS